MVGRMLLALSGAVERVEGERERESEAGTVGKDEVGEKREDERVEMKMKIQFMKMVTEEMGRGDKEMLRGLLKWVVDVVGEFEKELGELDGRRG